MLRVIVLLFVVFSCTVAFQGNLVKSILTRKTNLHAKEKEVPDYFKYHTVIKTLLLTFYTTLGYS